MRERVKKNNALINWAINLGEQSVKLAIDKAVLLPNFVQQPIKSVDQLLCSGMDLIEERAEYINNVYVHPFTENKYSLVLINNLEGMLTTADGCVNKYLPADILDIDEIQPREKLNKTLFHVVAFASKIAFTLVIAAVNERPLLQSHIAELLQELVTYTEKRLFKVAQNPAVIVEISKNLWTALSSNQLQYLKRIDNCKDLIEIVTFEVAKLIVQFIQNVVVLPLESLPTSIAKFSESLKIVLEREVAQVIPLSAI